MVFARLAILLPVALCLAQGSSASNPLVVDLGYAKYQGVPNANTGNTDYLGVRYAAPPTGEYRLSFMNGSGF